ncbi:MAG: flagellin [bacterium]|nr:flagellin [bacterium]
MSLAIKLNSSPLSLLNSLNQHNNNLYRSMEKLSSGYRINRASDGPADLVISEQLRARISSLQQEIENSRNQLSRYETGQSAVMELRNYLTDLRSLAVGASNEGFNSSEVQAAYESEAQSIMSSYNELISGAEFNGRPLLDGSEGSLAAIPDLTNVDLSSASSATASLAVIDEAISGVDEAMVEIGSTQRYELESSIRSMEVTRENLVASESMIRDVDMASEYTNFIQETFQTRLGLALLAHSAVSAETVLSLFD